MQRNRLNPGNRLQFESSVVRQVRRARQAPPRIGRLLALLALVGVLVGLAVWIAQFIHLPSQNKDDEALARMAVAVVDALRNNATETVQAISADSETGQAQLQEDDKQRSKTSVAPEAAVPGRDGACLAFLSAAQVEMTRQGIAWDQVKPLAFGGVRAEVLDPQWMKDPAVVFIGIIYFVARDTVYALELTARVCNAGAVITNFWKCAATDLKPEDVAAHSDARFRAFKQEPVQEKERVTITRSSHVFVPLQP